ncbi:MAG: hypothetical protein LC808_32635 [Actinobacteria bacterium]|nr:hypothetical protein [Actinomycetota bacterium]
MSIVLAALLSSCTPEGTLAVGCIARAAGLEKATGTTIVPGTVTSAEGDLATEVDVYVQSMPANGTAALPSYEIPTASHVERFLAGFACARDGYLDAAAGILAPLNYDVINYADTGTTPPSMYVLVREKSKAIHHWGIYTVAPNSPSPLTVEVPHPCPDKRTAACGAGDSLTHLVAVEAFRAVKARYLFITGAERRANGSFDISSCSKNQDVCADAAHNPKTMLYKVHEDATLFKANKDPRMAIPMGGTYVRTSVYQPHAFSYRPNHTDLEVENVNLVVSNGRNPWSATKATLSTAVFNALQKDFKPCLYKGAGMAKKTCEKSLGATQNVEAQFSIANDIEFISVEAESSVNAGSKSKLLAQVIACAMTPGC